MHLRNEIISHPVTAKDPLTTFGTGFLDEVGVTFRMKHYPVKIMEKLTHALLHNTCAS